MKDSALQHQLAAAVAEIHEIGLLLQNQSCEVGFIGIGEGDTNF
jgi:hypothetical protein